MTDQLAAPPDIKAHLDAADSVVDALPWRLGSSDKQRKAARGRVSALAHQVAALIASGWTVEEVRVVLVGAEKAMSAPNAAAQESAWRGALKRANRARKTTAQDPAGQGTVEEGTVVHVGVPGARTGTAAVAAAVVDV